MSLIFSVCSSEYFVDHSTPTDRMGPIDFVVNLGVGPVTQTVKDGGCQVGRSHKTTLWVGGMVVRFTVNDPPLDSATGQCH